MLGCFGNLIYFFRRLLFAEVEVPSFVGYTATEAMLTGLIVWYALNCPKKEVNE